MDADDYGDNPFFEDTDGSVDEEDGNPFLFPNRVEIPEVEQESEVTIMYESNITEYEYVTATDDQCEDAVSYEDIGTPLMAYLLHPILSFLLVPTLHKRKPYCTR
eukprot:6573184-Pyramimonas_sp.AAC.1